MNDVSKWLGWFLDQVCQDFVDLAEVHSRRWQRVLQYEREQRHHLEETIEQLAKQHNSLERAWRESPSTHNSEVFFCTGFKLWMHIQNVVNIARAAAAVTASPVS